MGPKVIKTKNQSDVTCVSFEPDGTHVIGADRSGYVRQWRVDNGEEIALSVMGMDGMVYAVVASPDGRLVLGGGIGNKVIIWDAVTQKKVTEVEDHTGHVYTVDVSSDSARFASGSHDNTVRIFDVASSRRVIPPLEHDSAVIGVKFSPDGSRIATTTYRYSFVGIYDTHSGNKLFDVPIFISAAPVTPLAWSANGQELFVASLGKITCINTLTWSHSEWSIHDATNVNVAIATHGKFIACSSGSSVSFWDSMTRKQVGLTIDHGMRISCVAISLDGKHLACGDAMMATFYALEEFLPEHHLRAAGISRLPLLQVSDAVLESWMVGNLTETGVILSDEIAHCSNPGHYALATRALLRLHLGEWRTAMEDADMSLQVKRSPIGRIARCIALVCAGKEEEALDDFDLVFRGCDPSDSLLLLVIKSILIFMCNKCRQAVSRLRGLIATADEVTEDYCFQVLGNMYLKQGDYENAVQTLKLVKDGPVSQEPDPLTTISIIFEWDFKNLKLVAWERLCEALYSSGSMKELGETLLEMVSSLAEDDREVAHGQVLQVIITRTREVTLLAWTGKSSTCNSCLPSSPAVFGQLPVILPRLEGEEMEKRTEELRAIFPLVDALATYRWVTRSQPVRFTRFHLHLPCIVFRVKRLRKEQGTVYHAETVGLGNVEFTTADLLPLRELRRLVFVNPWIHYLCGPRGGVTWEEEEGSLQSDVESNADGDNGGTETVGELARTSMIEELPPIPSDADSNINSLALQLIARIGQPFSALLLLRQLDGAYKRVAADHEIFVRGMGNNVPKDIRVQVLEVV